MPRVPSGPPSPRTGVFPPMHILHVTPCFPPTWAYGGIPRVAWGLARAQRERGHEVTVLTTDALGAGERLDVPLDERRDDLRVLTCRNLSNRLAYHHQLYLPRAVTRARPVRAWVTGGCRALLERLPRPDVIQLHGHRHLLNNTAVAFARRHDIPVVLTANGTLPRIERKVLLKAVWDRIVSGHVPHEAARCVAVTRAEVRQHLAAGIPAHRVVRIPNGLHLGEFDPLPPRGRFRNRWVRDRWGLPPSVPLVAYLGRLSPRKGVDTLVSAFEPPPPGGAALVVAGNDTGAERHIRRQVPPGAPVRFTGLLEGSERIELLVDADVLVYASTDEAFGLVPFEGLLAGTPAVVGDDCGCGELVAEAGAGLQAPPGDVAALRAHIATLLRDRALATRLVRRGRRYIADHLTWDRVAAQYLDLYERLLSASPHGPPSPP